jgi:hypothetical protein
VGNHYKFKRTTPMPHYDLEDMQIVIAQIRFPKGTIDTGAPAKDSFTWKSETAYKQLRHLVRNCQVVLQQADMKRRLADAQEVLQSNPQDERTMMDAMEQVDVMSSMIARLPKVSGELVWEGLYTPSQDVQKEVQMSLDGLSVTTERKVAKQDLEHDEVPMACMACSF